MSEMEKNDGNLIIDVEEPIFKVKSLSAADHHTPNPLANTFPVFNHNPIKEAGKIAERDAHLSGIY